MTGQSPNVFDTRCTRLELEPGHYSYCQCGYSKDGVFCDGAHIGKGFVPLTFEVKEKDTLALCLCKHTQTPPFCDGAHKPLREAKQTEGSNNPLDK